MSKLPHVFSDASVNETQTILGVVSLHLNIRRQVIINKKLDVAKAETLAILLAKKLTKGINCMYFTDNHTVAYKFGKEVNWIPREFNSLADSTARVKKPVNGIATFICHNYSTEKKFKLVNKALGGTVYKTFESLYKHSTVSKQLIKTLFKAKELPKGMSIKLHQVSAYKDKDLIKLLLPLKGK